MVYNVKHKLDQRILRKYFIRFYLNTHPGTINKYIIYEILRRVDIEKLKEEEEKIVNIRGRKYEIIKKEKELRIIRRDEYDSEYNEEEEREKKIDDYQKIVTHIKKEKKEEYREGEEMPEDVKKDLDYIDKRKKQSEIQKKKKEIIESEEEREKKEKKQKKKIEEKRKTKKKKKKKKKE